MPNFNFTGEYTAYRGLPLRVAMSYPGNWVTASFVGGIGSPSGRIGTWGFSAPVYDSGSGRTTINFYLTSAVTNNIKTNAAGYPYDIIAKFPSQDPVLILRGVIGFLSVASDVSSIGVGTNPPNTPNISITVTTEDEVSVLGFSGFSSALIDNAIIAHKAESDPHPNYLLESELSIASVPGLQTALDGKQPASNRLTEIATLTPSVNQIIQWNGSTWIAANNGAAGVSDHGNLTGLSDDDHPQYLTQGRGDLRYRLLSTPLVDSDIPSTIARDTEVSAAIAAISASSIGALDQATADGRYRLQSVVLTDSDIPSTIARDSEVTNAITSHAVASDPHPNYALESSLSPVATSGAYSDLTGLPNIPTSPEEIGAQPENANLTAISSLSTTGFAQRTVANTWTLTTLASVATSGAYADLSGRPSLATVATSGNYSDLTGRPSIPDSADDVGALSITANLSDIANAATARTNLGLGTAATESASSLRDRSTHTGSQAISSVTGLQTALDGKLSISSNLSDLNNVSTARSNLGLGTAATSNSADLRDRATHTGTQLSSTISDFGSSVDSVVSPSLVRDKLVSLSGSNRLPLSAIRDSGILNVYRAASASVTGTTAETTVATITIPALQDGDILRIQYSTSSRGVTNAGTKQARIRLIQGALNRQLHTSALESTQNTSNRDIYFEGGQVLSTSSSGSSQTGSNGNTPNVDSFSYSTSATITATITPSSSSETWWTNLFFVIHYRPTVTS